MARIATRARSGLIIRDLGSRARIAPRIPNTMENPVFGLVRVVLPKIPFMGSHNCPRSEGQQRRLRNFCVRMIPLRAL